MVAYSACGFAATDMVNIGLFPSTGPDAPVTSGAVTTFFPPATPNTAGQTAGENHTNLGDAEWHRLGERRAHRKRVRVLWDDSQRQWLCHLRPQ